MQLKYLVLPLVFVLSACATSQVTMNELDACLSGYSAQIESDYVLPYQSGDAFLVGQGNCTYGSHEIDTSQAYAYDFDMPIGTELVAVRGGEVLRVIEHFRENNQTPGQENYLVIVHDDDTISAYYHLTKNGALVKEGDYVEQGEVIALSGNTGDSTEPHLHFEVALCEDCQTLPINFRNTLKHKQGLEEGQTYLAQ